MTVLADRGRYLLSGHSAEGTASALVTAKGHTDALLLWYSGSGDGPTAGASAEFELLHSFDGSQGWTVISGVVVSAGEQGTARFAAGPYGYVRAQLTEVYSAAQTGTGAVYAFLRPGMR